MKSVFAKHLGKNVRFGKCRPVAEAPHLRLRKYLRAPPPAPPVVSYADRALPVLSDIYGNDDVGDCVIAGGYHIEGLATGNAGNLYRATLDQIIADYSAIGGYRPGQPATDNGCDMQTAMNYWTQHGFRNGTKLLGWLAVDATNTSELMTALYLFENLFIGVELPDAAISPFPSADGYVWDVAGSPDPENGHAVCGVGYNQSGVQIDSWGLIGTMTWGFLGKYGRAANHGEVYVFLTPDQLAKGQKIAPNGVDWTDLIRDFDALGGHVPVPTPPAPSPTPVPGHPVTLAEAQAWADAAIRSASPFLLTSVAISRVNAALAKNWRT